MITADELMKLESRRASIIDNIMKTVVEISTQQNLSEEEYLYVATKVAIKLLGSNLMHFNDRMFTRDLNIVDEALDGHEL